MPSQSTNLKKLLILSLMVAMDVALSPLFRIEGMAPMSSVMNVIGVMLMGPFYGTIMALVCGILRMMLLGIPPLALTGAVFGALLAGIFYKIYPTVYSAMFGEFLGTGIIGSLLSYPVMAWFTGSRNGMYWFFYTPRFIGGAVIGSFLAFIVMKKLANVPTFQRIQAMFFYEEVGDEQHVTHS